MLWPRLILFAFLALMIVGCGTTQRSASLALAQLERQLICPPAPTRLTEALSPPVFQEDDTWVSWSDKLLDFAAEQVKRRQELAVWMKENCNGKSMATPVR